MKLMWSLNIIDNKLDKESGSNRLESHRSLDEKRRTRIVRDITITPQGIPIRGKKSNRFHSLSGSIRGLGWMSDEDK